MDNNYFIFTSLAMQISVRTDGMAMAHTDLSAGTAFYKEMITFNIKRMAIL
jgi:hypothetical protein